jgi:ubiquinone/menaquinone biosynthesis C-methylase UbiE
MKMENKTSWGKVADWYDDLLDGEDGVGTYQRELILPNLMRILDPKSGQNIADIACGQGFFSRAIANQGANVIASDISPELIGLANKKPNSKVRYYVSPATNLSFIKSSSIDKAIIILAIQNIEHYNDVFRECSRILRPSGSLVVVLNHPIFRIPKKTSWGWEGEGESAHQYRRIDAYMSDERQKIDMNPGKSAVDAKNKANTYSFHRPLQSYIKSMVKSGLLISRIEEWTSHKVSEPGPRAKEENRMRGEIPMFMCIEGRKV